MAIEKQNFARIKTLTYLYSDACERGYSEYLAVKDKIDEIGGVEHHPEVQELERRHDIAGIQTIIFAAMCMESAIYEYAADHLGDAYVQDYLDKLDTLSKWVVSLRLIAGYELRKDRAPYAALKSLIAARNKLVHTKSEPLDFENIEAQMARVQRETDQHLHAIKNAYRALVLMSAELDLALGPMNQPLPSFDPEVAILRDTPERLRPIVTECREIVRRSIDDSAISKGQTTNSR